MARKRSTPVEPLIQVPIFIPTEEGAGELALGLGEIRGSTLILSFNDLYPAQAILQRMQRGGIVGITFLIPEEEAAEAKEREDAIQAEQDAKREEERTQVEKDLRDLDLLHTGDVSPENLGN